MYAELVARPYMGMASGAGWHPVSSRPAVSLELDRLLQELRRRGELHTLGWHLDLHARPRFCGSIVPEPPQRHGMARRRRALHMSCVRASPHLDQHLRSVNGRHEKNASGVYSAVWACRCRVAGRAGSRSMAGEGQMANRDQHPRPWALSSQSCGQKTRRH